MGAFYACKKKLITAPAVEPVSTADAKTWLYVTGSDHDTLIDSLVKTARRYIESEKDAALISQTWDIYLDEFPKDGDLIYFPIYPVSAISSVKYLDGDGTEQTLDAANYSLFQGDREWPFLRPGNDVQYPETQDIENAVYIRVTAGYGANATDVPEEVITAIKLLVKYWYDNPEDSALGNTSISARPWARSAKLLINNLFPR